jgi:hypothetical protein
MRQQTLQKRHTPQNKYLESNPIQKHSSKQNQSSSSSSKYTKKKFVILLFVVLLVIVVFVFQQFPAKQQVDSFDPRVTCKLPLSKVNDDYCDCSDGSDEYLTSACSHLRNAKFTCVNKGYIESYIHSSKVDDGVCDCCDGSDEKNSFVQCPNTCNGLASGLRTELQQKINTIKAGIQIRNQRAEISKSAAHNDNYGKYNEYQSLADRCLTYKSGQYEYELCMFKSITQKGMPGQRTNLGTFAKWNSNRSIQEYGAGQMCPGGPQRSCNVKVLCNDSDKDEIVSVDEPSRCTYEMIVKTPSACDESLLVPLERDLNKLNS